MHEGAVAATLEECTGAQSHTRQGGHQRVKLRGQENAAQVQTGGKGWVGKCRGCAGLQGPPHLGYCSGVSSEAMVALGPPLSVTSL